MTLRRISDKDAGLILAGITIGAFILCIGTLCWHLVPPENRELVAGLTGVLGLLARDAARWAWPTKNPEPQA